jgi:hypothetical protein
MQMGGRQRTHARIIGVGSSEEAVMAKQNNHFTLSAGASLELLPRDVAEAKAKYIKGSKRFWHVGQDTPMYVCKIVRTIHPRGKRRKR